MSIIITDDQLAERDRWERLLMEGKINLFDALHLMLKTGAPASTYLLDRLVQAEVAYNDGDFSDLAEAFGIALSRSEKRAMARETLRTQVKAIVTHFAESEGYKLLNPNQHPGVESAFTKATEHLNKKTQDGLDIQPLLTAATVFDIYYDRDSAGKKRRLSEIKK